MTYFYDDYVERYGKNPGIYWWEGIYITPDGRLFDVDTYASVAHAGGFVIPFFRRYMHPERKEIAYFDKEELLGNLLSCEKALLTRTYDVNPKEQQMRLQLVRYFINVYRSKYSVWDWKNEVVDFSEVTGIPNVEENWIGRDVTLKDVWFKLVIMMQSKVNCIE